MCLHQPPRRPSLRTESPEKGTQNRPNDSSKDVVLDVGQILKAKRHRAPRTYARKRPRAEKSAQLDARSATVSLDTRNCGEGRISLGTKALPLPVLAGGVGAEEDSFDPEFSSGEDSDSPPSRRRPNMKKRRGGAATKEDEATDEHAKLDEFLAQQKAFWDEVDESSLPEEDMVDEN